MKCSECRGEVVIRKMPFFFRKTNLGNFDTEVCTECNSIYYSGEVFEEIEAAAKQMEVWGSSYAPEFSDNIRSTFSSMTFTSPVEMFVPIERRLPNLSVSITVQGGV